MVDQRGKTRRRQGSALIEFALVSVLLFLLLLGILEFGLLFKDVHILNEAARVGARSAAIGNDTATIRARATNSSVSLDTSKLAITMRVSTDNGATFPNALGDSGGSNDAPIGSLIRVRLTYTHTMLTGYIIPSTTRTLTSNMVIHRE